MKPGFRLPTRRHALAALGLGIPAVLTTWRGSVHAQALRNITFVQPNPSAINGFQLHVAIGQGYFKDEGLNVRVETVDGSAPVLQALAAGQAHFGRPGPAPVLLARSRGVDVVFLYNAVPTSSFGIVVKRDSAYKSPADLKGKVIGVGTRDGAEVGFARAILNDLKMTEPRDYTFIPVGDGGPAAAGFLRGDIEAYVAATSDAAILNQRGIFVRDITPEKFLTYFGNGFAAMGDYIAKNPDIVEGFGRALVRGTKFAMDDKNRATVMKHLAAGNRMEGENQAFANALFEAVRGKATPKDLSKGWGYQDPAHWQAWQKSLLASGDLKKPLPNLEAAYTNKFIEAWNRSK
ncbi:MAG: PhnD/SsuA/transferrin family substrate-binding protein [Rhizobiales bacterium]|nr:PhnD/SsuA/transferrin family substrate-binding protein [Hyphomicrobiales bacterium]